MPTLEQVCKRIFSDSTWLSKSLLGGLLFLIPMFSFGYLYRLVERARIGDFTGLPEWTNWRDLFIQGLVFMLIALILGVLPVALAWILSLPLVPWLGMLGRLPLVPALLIAAPLSVAGVYRYQKRESFEDAFRLPALVRMLEASASAFLIPTFALIGIVVLGLPLLPWAFFLGAAPVFSFYARFFRFLEETRKARTLPP